VLAAGFCKGCCCLLCAVVAQVLRVFLEMPGDLSSNVRWSGLQPPSASIMEGTAKFSMQLIGRESRVRQHWGRTGTCAAAAGVLLCVGWHAKLTVVINCTGTVLNRHANA
jgi:hypothetical protein